MSDVEGMGWLKRVWLYGFGPLELVDEEDGVKYYATRSLKRSFRSVERSNRKYAKRYPHRFRYVEEPIDSAHRPLDSYRYRRDVKDMRASGTDGSLIDRAVSILARGDCLPASFDERYVFTDRRDMRDCWVGEGWRLIYCYSEKTLILVGLMEENLDGRFSSVRFSDSSHRSRSPCLVYGSVPLYSEQAVPDCFGRHDVASQECGGSWNSG